MADIRPKRIQGRTIFVAGVSKNAVSEAVAQLNLDGRYRVLHDPFNQWQYGKLWGLRYPAYLARTVPRDDVASLIDRVVDGRLPRSQTRAQQKERIISECRCNLWLDYLQTRYPQMPIVLTWRHPCATIASRLLLDWTPQLKRQLVLKPIIRDHLQPFMDEITRATTPLDQHTFMWAIHHFVPLQQFARGNLHFTFYESLVTADAAGEKLRDAVRSGPPANGQADAKSRNDQKSVLDTWRKQLSSAQIGRIFEILKIFGLDAIYSADTYPDENAAYEMLRSA